MIARAEAGFDRWDELLALILTAFAGMEGRIDPPSSAHLLTPETLAKKARSEVLFLARTGDALTGCLFCAPQGDALYLGKLAVAPDVQERGIGRSLVAAAKDHAVAAGFRTLRLQTRIELEENHAAFAAMGFSETARTAHPGFDRPTSITMELELAATPPKSGP